MADPVVDVRVLRVLVAVQHDAAAIELLLKLVTLLADRRAARK